MTDLDRMLERLWACDEAREWAKGYATLDEAWDACKNPQWMLWLAQMTDLPKEQSVRMAVAFARSVLHLVTEGEDRPRIAIETAEKWLRGEATVEECRSASAAAWAASDAASAAASAAAWVAWVAAWVAAMDAARAAAWAAWVAASDAASDAAWAAAWAASDAASDAASVAQCDTIRSIQPRPDWPGVLRAMQEVKP